MSQLWVEIHGHFGVFVIVVKLNGVRLHRPSRGNRSLKPALNLVDNASLVSAKTILLVDDQDGNRIMTKWFLNNFGYTVESARSAEEGLSVFSPKVHDLIITDNSMPGMTGAEMAHIIKLRSPTTPVVMFTGAPPADRSCLDLVLQRPMHLLRLKEAVDQLLSGSSLRAVALEESDLHSSLL